MCGSKKKKNKKPEPARFVPREFGKTRYLWYVHCSLFSVHIIDMYFNMGRINSYEQNIQNVVQSIAKILSFSCQRFQNTSKLILIDDDSQNIVQQTK